MCNIETLILFNERDYLDEEIQNLDNKWYFNYNKDSEVLRIGNKLSKLSTKSLLLGCSTKKDDTKNRAVRRSA